MVRVDSGHHKVLTSGRRRQRWGWRSRADPWRRGLCSRSWGHRLGKYEQPPEAGKGQDTDCPPEPPEGTQPCPALCVWPSETMLDPRPSEL